MSGAAIVRFQEQPSGHLLHYDTRYFDVTVSEDYEYQQVNHSHGDCTDYYSDVLLDPGSYSGLYAPPHHPRFHLLLSGPKPLPDGTVVLEEPFGGLNFMTFAWHQSFLSGCGSTNYSRQQTRDSILTDNIHFPRNWTIHDFVLRSVVPKDTSAFSLDKEWSLQGAFGGAGKEYGSPITFHWTARADRMGACAGHDGPIQEDDPIINNEDIHIDADHTQIAPDGKTKVHIRVTCEGVPVQGAKVEIQVEPVDSSGGHIHTDDRPKGKLDGKNLTVASPSITLSTDGDGKVKGPEGITFAPPGKQPNTRCLGLAGDYQVTAKLTAERFSDRKDSTMIVVGLDNLVPLPKGQDYAICADSKYSCPTEGAWGTETHPDSENGTPGTITVFQNLATEFLKRQDEHNQWLHDCGKPPWPTRKVSFNDIALPWGGLFDWKATWQQPHKTHGRGQGGDFNHFQNYCGTDRCEYESCGGAYATFDTWLWSVLKAVGEEPQFGKWDGEYNTTGDWHLHVEDQGVTEPSECPQDN